MNGRINHLAVWCSAIAFWVLGAIWYTALFGRMWMQMQGKAATPSDSAMATQFIGSFILDVILGYVIATALSKSDNPNMARHGAEFGIFMGLGVFGTMYGMNCLYEGRPFALWAINTGYVVVGMAMMGAIVGAWRARAAVSG